MCMIIFEYCIVYVCMYMCCMCLYTLYLFSLALELNWCPTHWLTDWLSYAIMKHSTFVLPINNHIFRLYSNAIELLQLMISISVYDSIWDWIIICLASNRSVLDGSLKYTQYTYIYICMYVYFPPQSIEKVFVRIFHNPASHFVLSQQGHALPHCAQEAVASVAVAVAVNAAAIWLLHMAAPLLLLLSLLLLLVLYFLCSLLHALLPMSGFLLLLLCFALLCFGASFEYLCEVTALPLTLFILSFFAAVVVVVNILLSLVSV